MGADEVMVTDVPTYQLYNEKLGQINERGVFLKNTLTSKKWVVASVTSRAQPAEARPGCSPGRVVVHWLELTAKLEQHSRHAPSQAVLKELLWCLKLWFYRAARKGNRLPLRARVFWLTCYVLGHRDRPHSGPKWGTHADHPPVHFANSVGLCWGSRPVTP